MCATSHSGPRYGAVGPTAVTRQVVRGYLAYLTTRGYAPRTISRKVAGLRRYFDWQVRRHTVDIDPMTNISAPSGAARLPRVLRADEIHQLLGLLAGSPARLDRPTTRSRCRDVTVLELLYGSGLRVSELCSLDDASVDLSRRRLSVWGKGNKQRIVPISEPAADVLSAWLAGGSIGVRANRSHQESPAGCRGSARHCSAIAGADG